MGKEKEEISTEEFTAEDIEDLDSEYNNLMDEMNMEFFEKEDPAYAAILKKFQNES